MEREMYDFVKHHYFELVNPPSVFDNIRLYSISDIAAMKVAAILKRGVKKDFWDMAEILEHLDLSKIIELYHQKYPSQQLLISIPQALTYFEDAEESEDPQSLKSQNWNGVKKAIKSKVDQYLR